MGRMGNEGNAMNKDLVSIIMLAHGRMQFVEESVRSVLAQTYSRWELLCVDDSPGYEVVRLLQDLKGNDSRIHVYQSVVQEGACNDRNSALKDAHGRWIAFLDCGDVWEPEKLERQVAFMEERGYAFSYTAYLRRGKRIVSGLPVVGWDELQRYCWINYLTMMYDCQKLGKVYTKGVCHLKDAYELMLEISKGRTAISCQSAWQRVGNWDSRTSSRSYCGTIGYSAMRSMSILSLPSGAICSTSGMRG